MIPMFSMESAIDPRGDTDIMLYVVLSLIGLCLEGTAFNKAYNMTMGWLRKRTGGRRGMITNPPNKTQGIVGIVWGGVFVLFGLAVVTPVTAPFGGMWTLLAAVITVLHIYQTFVKRYPKIHNRGEKSALDAEHRLRQLESLRAAGLMTDQEYRQKRRELLGRL